jgi:GAF domain-containing protein
MNPVTDAPVPLDAEGIREAAARLCVDVCAVLDIARCSVFLREPGGDRFVGIAAHPGGRHEQDVRGFRIGGESDAMTSAVVERGAPVFVRDTAADPRTAQSAVRRWKVRTLLGLPLSHRDEVIGVAWVDNADRAYP